MKSRLDWLGKRQVVLAENIANADTPTYRPKDLPPQRFRDVLGAGARLGMAATNERHLGQSDSDPARMMPVASREAYEITPAGNAVVLEEQMAKVQETAIDHRLVNQLYRKYLGMLRIAATARG
jgi:flagellar basal-body rod protein FlgB